MMVSIMTSWRPFHVNVTSQRNIKGTSLWHERPLGLEDELILFWLLDVTVTSQNTFLAIAQQDSDNHVKMLHKCLNV